MTNTTSDRLDPEARRAAIAARRAAWAPSTILTVTTAEIVANDFIERIPTQNGVRGARVETTVKAVETTWDEWGQRTSGRRGMFPVEGRRFSFHTAALVDVSVPATFTVVIRRTAVSS